MKMFFCFQILQVIHLSKIELKHCAGQKSIKNKCYPLKINAMKKEPHLLLRRVSYLKSLFLMTCLLIIATSTLAQTKNVIGTVTDISGEALIGVSILVQGTNNGVVTDLNGKYTLNHVPENATLVVSYIGMLTQEIKVNGQSTINIILKEDSQQLEEIIVIGYGAAKAKDLTAPITVVKGETLTSVPSTTPMAALQGKVPGVNIVNNGAPGEGPTVQIRGIGSFSNSKPLFVVDGMFYDNINFLNNADIQEMSILKDASAAAIYGVRAANGVVLINSKKRSNVTKKQKITYDGYVGIQKASNVLELCNAHEYATMLLEGNYDAYQAHFKQSIDKYGGSYADTDFHNWTFGADNNWYDQLLRTAVITNHSLNINGGSDKAVYSVGASYLYQDGIMNIDNNYKRMNFRGSVDYDAANWLKVGFNGVFSNSTQQVPNNQAWQKAFNCPPIVALYDENNDKGFPDKFGSPDAIGYTSNFYNPIATAKYFDSSKENYQVLSNFYAQIDFIPNKLNFKTNYSYSFLSTQGREFTPKYYVSSWQQSATTQLTKMKINTITIFGTTL